MSVYKSQHKFLLSWFSVILLTVSYCNTVDVGVVALGESVWDADASDFSFCLFSVESPTKQFNSVQFNSVSGA